MSQTLTFDAYTAYLAIVKAALPGVTVYDGPTVTRPTKGTFLIVGADDPMTNGLQQSVDSGDQQWENLGAGRRVETFLIKSVMVVWSGGKDLAAARAIASTNIDAIAAALRPAPAGTGDAMLDNVLNQNGVTGWCGLAITGIEQGQSTTGCVLHVPFTLAVTVHHL